MASAPSIRKQGQNAPGRVANTGTQQRSTAVGSNGRGTNHMGTSRGRVAGTRRTRG